MIEGYIKVLQYWTHVTESFVDFGPLIVENLKINPAFKKKLGQTKLLKFVWTLKTAYMNLLEVSP